MTKPGFSRIMEFLARKEFFRPEKTWKMSVVMESHGIPPMLGHNRRTVILGVKSKEYKITTSETNV